MDMRRIRNVSLFGLQELLSWPGSSAWVKGSTNFDQYRATTTVCCVRHGDFYRGGAGAAEDNSSSSNSLYYIINALPLTQAHVDKDSRN